MLTVEKREEGSTITLELEGKLDTATAPELDEKIVACGDNFDELILDFTKLNYISSAGLRVLLKTLQDMHEGGEFTITNVNPDIMDIFEVTGFNDILNIK